MIDRKKRATLKILSVASGALGIAGTPMAAVLSRRIGNTDPIEVAGIQLSTRLSVERNDIEIVLTNTTNQAIELTQITPGSTRVARGEFNFSALFDDGPITLNAGNSLSVPLQRKPVTIDHGINSNTGSLRQSLKQSLSILSDSKLPVPVTFANTAAVA